MREKKQLIEEGPMSEAARKKKAVRASIRSLKKQYTAMQLRLQSLPIIDRLLALPQVKDSPIILAYYSMSDEVDTHQLVRDLDRAGHLVLLPRVVDGEHLELREYHGDQDLKEGIAYHILEPVGPVFPLERYGEIGTAIIPGVAFDKQGHRCGHGKGYYDRMLKQLTTSYKIGIAFPFQIIPDVPTNDNDVRMDDVIF
ncbi:MAG: 5-formyltetrahydrofolate cyclo-ligase [Prevotellaceae bacterium]|nr:5-formyltetrahydrofolate cyclo-ligase [Prevotellaceae bacterium]